MTTTAPRERTARRAADIDPRIRDRRVAVIRAQGRRRLRILLAAVVLASTAGLAWVVVQSPLLAVDHVRVRGAQHTGAAAVEHAAAVGDHAPLLLVSTGAIARRVERLPWVRHAVVHLVMPHTVRIDVTERAVVAWVPAPAPATAVGLVDGTGRVLAVAPAAPPGVPEITGVPAVPDAGRTISPATLARAIAPLPAELRARTRQVVAGPDAVTLLLGPGPGGAAPAAGEVRLGPPTDLGAKGRAALAVILRLGAQNVAYVDVEVPSAPATG